MDRQAQHVYAAEDLVSAGATLRDPIDVCMYVEAITTSPWWLDQELPPVRTLLWDVPHAAAGFDGGFFVRVGVDNDWGWRELVIAHELAHIATLAGDLDLADHGPIFCTRFLECLGALAGETAFDQLRQAFQHLGIAYHAPGPFDPRAGASARAACGLP